LASRRARITIFWMTTLIVGVAAYFFLSSLVHPGGRAFTGAPVVMDLGWTAR